MESERPRVSEVLRAKGGRVHAVRQESTVAEAVDLMNQMHVGCTLIVDASRLVGIFTERDVLSRIVAVGRDPAATVVRDVMSHPPLAVGPDFTVAAATRLMLQRHCRHLPIVLGEVPVGVISMSDIITWTAWELEHDVVDLMTYVAGPAARRDHASSIPPPGRPVGREDAAEFFLDVEVEVDLDGLA